VLYREAGQYKTTYAADMAIFPLREDRIGLALIIAFAYLLAFVGNSFLLQAVLIRSWCSRLRRWDSTSSSATRAFCRSARERSWASAPTPPTSS
jgi:hypothetical protein